ncbi:hypothetical protein H5U35_02910 [Candidatus Aerophobetes bacterium]|nr:hypothetical protein [Candidatus Aerophobetes bacterium]
MKKAPLFLIMEVLGIMLALYISSFAGETGSSAFDIKGKSLQTFSPKNEIKASQEKSPHIVIKSISNFWGDVSSDKTPVNTRMLVEGIDLSGALISIFCSIYMNDVKMLEDRVRNFTAEKKGKNSFVVHFTTYIDNNSEAIIRWWSSHIRNGEKTRAKIKGELNIKLGKDNLKCPFLWENEFQTNILEGINLKNVRNLKFGVYTLQIKSLTSKWAEITPEYTQIRHTLEIYNPGILPGTPVINSIKYMLFLNNIKMTEDKIGLPVVIWPKETKYVSFTTKLESIKIKKWWISHIKSNEKTNYELNYTLFIKFFGLTLAKWQEKIKGAFDTDFLGRK